MKSNEERLVQEIKEKNEELSRVKEELSQEHERAKQPSSLPTEVKVTKYVHIIVTIACIDNTFKHFLSTWW